MKWKHYSLEELAGKARKHFFFSFSIGASDHALSKRLVGRFGTAQGPMFAIAMEGLDLERVQDFRWAGTYSDGKQWYEAQGSYTTPSGHRSIDGLVQFLNDYLGSKPSAVVICENWAVTREQTEKWETVESRLLYYRSEVYHVATHDDVGKLDLIEATVSDADYQWLNRLCSRFSKVPEIEIDSETFFDQIVENTEHIFVSAFDGEGYLVWTPKNEPRNVGATT